MNLLLVDDDAIYRAILEKQLSLFQFHIDQADSGEQALALLKKNKYDTIIVDNFMPGISGLELLEKIPQGESLKIMVSVENLKEKALEAGADFFFTKAVKTTDLANFIVLLLEGS